MQSYIVVLRFSKFRYSGQSIGNDLRIELQINGNWFGINKTVNVGQEVQIDRQIIQFRTDQRSSSIPVIVKVIERDPVFNDVGGGRSTFKIDLATSTVQTFSQKVRVSESAGPLKGKTAIFDVQFVATALQATRYVVGNRDGWLLVQLAKGGRVSLPEGLKVEIDRIEKSRAYFLILEDAHQGKMASVKFSERGEDAWLGEENPQTGPVRLSYSISNKRLRVLSTGESFRAVDDPSALLEEGVYDIEIPDHPHHSGLHYPDAPHARTWFRIGHQKARYIHTGARSAGCLTIKEVRRWEKLYARMIYARKGDGQSVGTLKVIP